MYCSRYFLGWCVFGMFVVVGLVVCIGLGRWFVGFVGDFFVVV